MTMDFEDTEYARIERRIGEGGMSAVYLAVRADDEYRQEVAVKVFALG